MVKKRLLVNGIDVGEVEASGDTDADAQRIMDFLKEKGLHREISKDDAMHGQANSFARVAIDLYKRDLKKSPFQGHSVAPFVVNAVLSIEIYLKVLNHISGTGRGNHNLWDLYERLDDATKSVFLAAAQDVRPHYRLEDGVEIVKGLKSLSKAFENWRYLYEHNRLQTEIQLIRYVMHVAHEACCRVRIDAESTAV